MRRKDILFLHQGFPGQFYHWAAALAAKGHRVVFLSSKAGGQIPGVVCTTYEAQTVEPGGHVLLEQYGRHVETGCAVWRSLAQLKAQGFHADAVICHADFGVGLFVKQVYPATRLIVYCEWFFQSQNNEWDFDPVDAVRLSPGHIMKLQLSNAESLLVMKDADLLLTPSEWQRSRFPREYRERMQVVPDGIDTQFYHPPARRQTEMSLVTYVSRTMEPFRGFEKMVEATALLLQQNPDCKVVFIGQTDRHEYSSAPPAGRTYTQLYLEQFPLDPQRVQFTGWLPEHQLLQVLQASSVHVYLTRPFVLSWSFLQALSTGCAVIASQTAPVLEEVEQAGASPIAELVDYFSPASLAAQMQQLLMQPEQRQRLGENARSYLTTRHDLATWVEARCRLVEEC